MAISSPDKLYKKLIQAKIEYGFWDSQRQQPLIVDLSETDVRYTELSNDMDYIERNCYLQKPSEIWKHKVAICWDMALLIYFELKNQSDIDTIHVAFAQWTNTDKSIVTHTPVIFKYLKEKHWYWIEYSDSAFRGIHKLVSLDHKSSCKELCAMQYPDKTITILKYNIPCDKFLSKKYLRLSQFYNQCMNSS
jgi:hypothetical protein